MNSRLVVTFFALLGAALGHAQLEGFKLEGTRWTLKELSGVLYKPEGDGPFPARRGGTAGLRHGRTACWPVAASQRETMTSQ